MSALTEAEYALVARCAAAVCDYCGNPKWEPASWNDGDYYHQPKRGKVDAAWCDANAIWHEIWDEPDPLAILPLWARAPDPATGRAAGVTTKADN